MSSLPNNLFSPTFQRQGLGFLFSTIMAIMVYLATLAMALQLALSVSGLHWSEHQENRMTIELPASSTSTEATQKIIDILKTNTAITTLRLVPRDEAQKLLKPWFKEESLLDALPLPVLIDIEVKPDAKLTASALRTSLSSLTPDIQIDDHADWLVQLQQIVSALTALGWLMILLTALSLIIAVSLICRAAMAVEHKTIDLLHIMGATDRAIAHSFARHALLLSWPSAVVGFALGVGTLFGLAHLLKTFLMTSNFQITSHLDMLFYLAIIPTLSVVGAVVTARSSVLHLLRLKP